MKVAAPAQRALLRLFGRLPPAWRRGLVRAGSPTWVLGAACVVEHDGAVLLVRHGYIRGWGLPGGGMARGEVPVATAVREAMEEVGLAIEPHGAPELVVDARHRRMDVVYRCRLAAGAVPASARPTSAEIVEVRWVAAGSLGTMALNRAAAGALRQVGHTVR